MTTEVDPAVANLAASQIEGLKDLMCAIAEFPEIAPVLQYPLQNMCAPLGSLPDPGVLLDTVVAAFMTHNAEVAPANDGGLIGVTARFAGNAVCVWTCMPGAEEPVEIEAEPVSDDSDNSEAEAEQLAEVAA